MDEDIYLLIERDLAGELNAEEKKSFEDRIKSDKDFAEKVLLYRSLNEKLRSRFLQEEEEQRLRTVLSEISKTEIPSGKNGKTIPLRWYHFAAAATIALLAIAWFYTSKLAVPEYSQYAFHGSLALAERGIDSLQHQAEDAFNSKNYAEAIQYFNRLLEADPDNTELQLYKGVSLLELDQVEEAESIFNTIKNSNAVYKDKAIWYLALSALKQKDYDLCEALLEQLPENSEDYNKAEELLDKL